MLEPSRPLERESSAPEWQYHPRQPARLARMYDLGEGQRLFVGALGERWLVQPSPGRSPLAQPASVLAPEPLVGVLGIASPSLVFIGRSGSAYHANSPLGPLLASSAPLERLARVDTGRTHLLGVAESGRLMLSEDAGTTWRAVGPEQSRFSDVLLAPPYGLALEVPERLWWSDSEGREWAPLDMAPFGAERLERDEEAGPVVLSPLGARAFRTGGTSPRLEPLGRTVRPEEPRLDAPPLEGANARAIAAGRAFVSDGGYFEVELGVRAESLSGRFLGSLERRNVPALSPCQDVQVAGFGHWVYAACTRERVGTARLFEFFRSEDSGVSFGREPYTARGNPELVRLAVGQEGVLLVTGLCPPKDESATCHPRGIQARRVVEGDAGASAALEVVPAPALEETALALSYSADGRTAYAVGQRTKGESLFAFVSSDIDDGFAAREISRLEPNGSSSSHQVRSLVAARDGHVSLVLGQTSGADQIVLLDENARTLSIHPGPLQVAALGAYGTRALAVSPDEVWESLDGGAHWESAGRLPRSVCPTPRGRCNTPIYCQREGCTLGDILSRIGWHGRAAGAPAVLPPTASRERSTRRAVRTAFGCELLDSEWAALAGVDRLPDASQAAVGRAAWFALSRDDATAAAGLWIAESAPEGARRVRYSELLRASERPAESAYFATLQVEGAAALRYSIPGSAGASATRLTRVEVAWENLFEQRRARATIADAGAHLPGDFAKAAGPARRAQVDLLSIATGGIYARVHRQPGHNQITYFSNGSGVEEIPPLTSDLIPAKGAGSEMVRIGSNHLALIFLNQGATVVRGRHRGERWNFDAMSVGFVDAELFALRHHAEITYSQGRAGLHVTTRYANGSSEGYVFPLQPDGPVFGSRIAAPTQANLEDGSFGCTPSQRQSSPRLIAPHQAGTRHPVLVHDPVEPERVFLSDAAVLHGSPQAPCALAFDAEALKSAPDARERALIIAEGPSWLFRVAPDSARRDVRIEYRAMKCRLDAGLEAPPDVYDLTGTRVAE